MQLAMLRRDSGGHLVGRAVCGSEWTVAAWLGLVLVALLVGARQQLLDLSDTVLGKVFLDSMGGGAWPFLVGGVICLVNSVNERDLNRLNSHAILES